MYDHFIWNMDILIRFKFINVYYSANDNTSPKLRLFIFFIISRSKISVIRLLDVEWRQLNHVITWICIGFYTIHIYIYISRVPGRYFAIYYIKCVMQLSCGNHEIYPVLALSSYRKFKIGPYQTTNKHEARRACICIRLCTQSGQILGLHPANGEGVTL